MAFQRSLTPELAQVIAQRLRVLAQPLRIRIIDSLELGEVTVQELADGLGVSQQTVSKHLVLLHQAGVVTRRQEGRFAWYAIGDPDVLNVFQLAEQSIGRQLRDLGELIDITDRDDESPPPAAGPR